MTRCEQCPSLALCIAQESGKCELIYEDINQKGSSRDGVWTNKLSHYRKILRKNYIWVRSNQQYARFIK